MPIYYEYIWIDGTKPTQKLRSKTKIVHGFGGVHPSSIPNWNFDGSSTGQATGDKSDCILVPVYCVPDPIRVSTRERACYLVLCEVMNSDGTPHESNQRAKLRELLGFEDPQNIEVDKNNDLQNSMMECLFGLEQEFTLFKGSRPLGFPEDRRFPPAQGPYYCGVGADEVFGRPLVEQHMLLCQAAGLILSGINSEVMPGQWEFQIGPLNPIRVSDQLWLARWLLYRIGEEFGINATLDAKPVPGDWNGAGMHTNFSTKEMREKTSEDGKGGIEAIYQWCVEASLRTREHLEEYGHGIESRLTGAHETCSYKEFRYGISDRTASIRIPLQTSIDGHGYLEDRRPNANACPYKVVTVMLETAYGRLIEEKGTQEYLELNDLLKSFNAAKIRGDSCESKDGAGCWVGFMNNTTKIWHRISLPRFRESRGASGKWINEHMAPWLREIYFKT